MSVLDRRHSLVTGFVTAMLASASLAAPAWAEGPTREDIATARELGQDGVELANAGRCEEAIDRLERAERIFHAPTTLGRLGECEVKVGRLVHGTEILQRVVREPLPPNAPAPFVAARTRAKRVLDAALTRIARLRVTVDAPEATSLEILVDGEPLPSSVLGNDWLVDPGVHKVQVSAPGFGRVTSGVLLKEGERQNLSFSLAPEPRPATPPSAVPSKEVQRPAAPAAAKPADEGDLKVGAVIAYVIGALGIAAGTSLAILASSRPQDDSKTFQTASAFGFAVGATGIIAGTYALLTPPPAPAAPAPAAFRTRPREVCLLTPK